MICLPTRSFPASEMNEVFTPQRPNEMMALKVDPPGYAPMGWSFLNMMSRTVSPIPITLRIYKSIMVQFANFYIFGQITKCKEMFFAKSFCYLHKNSDICKLFK